MRKCKDCGVELYGSIFIVRCRYCSAEKTKKRKYQRRHEHRKKIGNVK